METKPFLLAATLSVTAMSFIPTPRTPTPPFAASAPSTSGPSSAAAPPGGPSLPAFANTSSTSSMSSAIDGSPDGAFMIKPGLHLDEVQLQLELVIDPRCHEILFADRSGGRHGRAGGEDWCLDQIRSAFARQYPELAGPGLAEPVRVGQPSTYPWRTGSRRPDVACTPGKPLPPPPSAETRHVRSDIDSSR